MNVTLKNIVITVNSIALIASILWTIKKPDYDSIISTLVLFAALIGLWISKTSKNKELKQNQKSGNNSKNYQAGNDINIQE